MSHVQESATQASVREAIAALGGYWKPANAAVRLLEELGELAELDAALSADPDAIAGECADLWIISTAIADQFYAVVPNPDGAAPGSASSAVGDDIAGLAAAAGRVGRIVNYYDGPKVPRSLDGWMSLDEAVAELHARLASFASQRGVDLRASVEAVLSQNAREDAGRFEPTYDPRTAPVLSRFAVVCASAAYPHPGDDRLFGAPDWKPGKLGPNVEALRAPLTTFLRAAVPERLDGFVIGGPEAASLAASEAWAGEVVRTLELKSAPVTPSTFSPFRPEGGPLWSSEGTFLLLRPGAAA